LIDCHTHTVFGGNRSGEFEQRLQGVSYAEIAAAGGGIVWAGSFIVHDYVRQGRLLPLTLKPGRKGQLQFENAPLDFFACFKDRQYVPAKVRALVDYLLEELQQQAKLS
ncbi:MAG: hypothetical protein RR574_16970, partial [Comamonas sp.]